MRAPRKRSLASFIFEDADPAKIDSERFPLKLSDAQRISKMQYQVTQGPDDAEPRSDDMVKAAPASFPCSELKPSQSSMNLPKALSMAVGMINKGEAGGDLGAFVSNDKFIMDGHHRWISSFMVDPAAVIKGFEVNLPGEKLVAVLNALTAGKYDHAGKPASGGFAQFKDAGAIKKELTAALEKGFENGASADEVKSAIEKFAGGDIDEMVEKLMKNLSEATLSAPSWAPERPDMPVIEKEDIQDAINALNNGEIDLNPPYAGEDVSDRSVKGNVIYVDKDGKNVPKGTPGAKKKVVKVVNAEGRRHDGYVMERWQKLAGLIKD